MIDWMIEGSQDQWIFITKNVINQCDIAVNCSGNHGLKWNGIEPVSISLNQCKMWNQFVFMIQIGVLQLDYKREQNNQSGSRQI